MSVFLGVDIGTSGTKTLAINEAGEVLAESTSTYSCSYPKPLWSEQNPDDWWRATKETIQAVIKQASLKPSDVKAIGLSGQMHGAVFLDKDNKVIRPAILWNDQRTTTECAEIEEKAGGRHNLIKLVANPALTGFTAPKIIWLRKNEPQNFEKTRKVLLPKDEIRRRLTGEFATDVSDASGMLLLDVANRTWSKTLLEKLEIDAEWLAPCFESPEITGKLTAEVANELGLTTECVVVGGAGDCAAGAIGTGIVNSGAVSTSIGTSGVFFVHSDKMQVDPAGRLHTFCHAVPGKWHMMGVTLSCGGSLQWFRNQLCKAEMEAAQETGQDPYNLLTKEAQQVPPGSEGLYFLPYLSGERTPHADPDARGCFIGLTVAHTRGHMVRSIMEGVVFSLRDSLEIVKELGVPLAEIRTIGGGAQSPLWRQMQADGFGKKVVTVNANHGAAYGVALLAAVGAGNFKNVEEACGATIKTATETLPDNASSVIYNRAYPIYQGLYNSLKADFKRISMVERERSESETISAEVAVLA